MGLKASVNAAKEVVKAFDNGLLGVKRFNFKSQICTTMEQSERLLSLGLKKETADMGIYYSEIYGVDRVFDNDEFDETPTFDSDEIPAWSLHRLIEVMPQCIYHKNCACFLFIDQSVYVQYRHSVYGASQTIVEQFMKSNLWENLINCIEWLIKEGHFNKEYLV